MSAVEVVPRETGWAVVFNGVDHATALDKDRAEEVGRDLARRWGASLRIGNESGGERETHRFCLTGAGD